MSVKIMSQVWENGPSDKAEAFVLLAIADYCNDEGECWPSVASIARKARMTERGVQKICARLCEIGWLQIDLRRGRHGCNLYRIQTPNPVHPEPRSPRTPEHQTPNPVRQNPEPRSPEPSVTVKEPSQRAREAEKKNAIEAEFSTWWEQYPRKVGKLAAKKAYAKAVKSASAEDLLSGLKAQLPHLRDQAARGFCPHPSTWLNAGRWEDAVDTSAPPPKRTGELDNDDYLRGMGIL